MSLSYKVYGSDDQSNWTTIKTFTGNTHIKCNSTCDEVSIIQQNSIDYKYVKLQVVESVTYTLQIKDATIQAVTTNQSFGFCQLILKSILVFGTLLLALGIVISHRFNHISIKESPDVVKGITFLGILLPLFTSPADLFSMQYAI